jgi:hypothetical protein
MNGSPGWIDGVVNETWDTVEANMAWNGKGSCGPFEGWMGVYSHLERGPGGRFEDGTMEDRACVN